MAKIHVIARFMAREGSDNQLRALLQSMLTPTRAESGCELYELYESDTKGRFYLRETWASQAALDLHLATPHFKRLKETGGELVKNDFDRSRRGVTFAATRQYSADGAADPAAPRAGSMRSCP
jgi:quinol monooxygenase YgiN